MQYIDSASFLDLLARSGKTEKDFCKAAGVSREVFYRLLHYGGPVRLPTLRKVTSTLGVAVETLVQPR
jgi:DNA-binding phage protein